MSLNGVCPRGIFGNMEAQVGKPVLPLIFFRLTNFQYVYEFTPVVVHMFNGFRFLVVRAFLVFSSTGFPACAIFKSWRRSWFPKKSVIFRDIGEVFLYRIVSYVIPFFHQFCFIADDPIKVFILPKFSPGISGFVYCMSRITLNAFEGISQRNLLAIVVIVKPD